jgi:hypothetical protein
MDVPSYGVTNSISSEPSATRIRALGIVSVITRNMGDRLGCGDSECFLGLWECELWIQPSIKV